MDAIQEGISKETSNVCQDGKDDNGPPCPAEIDQAPRETIIVGEKCPFDCPNTGKEEIRIRPDVSRVITQVLLKILWP